MRLWLWLKVEHFLRGSDPLERGVHFPSPRSKGAILVMVSIFAALIGSVAKFGDFMSGVQMIQGFIASEKEAPEEYIYEKEETPTYKGPEIPPVTLGSLDLKHLDSRPDLRTCLRKRTSRDPQALKTALILLDGVIEKEKPTASDELLSHLYTLRSDLLLTQGKLEAAISLLETTSKLQFYNREALRRLLSAYKAENQKLLEVDPWPADQPQLLRELNKKIRALEEELFGHELSIFEDLSMLLNACHFVCDGQLAHRTVADTLPRDARVGSADPLFNGYIKNQFFEVVGGNGADGWYSKPSEGEYTIYAYIPSDAGGITAPSFINYNVVRVPKDSEDLRTVIRSVKAGEIIENISGSYTAPTRAWSTFVGNTTYSPHLHFEVGANTTYYAHLDQAVTVGTDGNFARDSQALAMDVDGAGATGFERQVVRHLHLSVQGYSAAHSTFVSTPYVPVPGDLLHESVATWSEAPPLERFRYGHFATHGALAIGVNGDGTAGLGPLRHADQDAQRVAAALNGLDFRSRVLVNHSATRTKILAELSRIVRASQPGDEFVFYFSGHGFTDINGHPVLVTGGSGPAAAGGGALETLSLEELANVLSFYRGRAIVVLDNCLNEVQIQTGTRDRPVAGPNPATFLLAGAPGGRVIESPRLGSGLFTFTLLRFLEQHRSPKLDFDAMYRYTATETSRLARELYGANQRPQMLLVR